MWLSSAYFVKYNEKNEKGLAFLGDLHFFYTGRKNLMRSEFKAHGAAWKLPRKWFAMMILIGVGPVSMNMM